MHFSTIAKIAAFAGVAVASPIELTNSATNGGPDPATVYVNKIGYAGSGCPAQSVTGMFTDDRQIFTLTFSNFVAQVGETVSAGESRKNCQLNIDIHYPGGYQFGVFEATYRGYAGLDKGVVGVQSATYYFSGDRRQATLSTPIKGPYSDNYAITDTIPEASVVWSPCGTEGILNINAGVSITPFGKKGMSGLMTTDSIDGKFTTLYSVGWRKC